MPLTMEAFTNMLSATTVRDFAYAVRKAAIIIHPEDSFTDLVELDGGAYTMNADQGNALNDKLGQLWNEDDEERWNEWTIGTTKADAEFRIAGSATTGALAEAKRKQVEDVAFDVWRTEFVRFASRRSFVKAEPFHGTDSSVWDNEAESSELAALWVHPDGTYYVEYKDGRFGVVMDRSHVMGRNNCEAACAAWVQEYLEGKRIIDIPEVQEVEQ